MRLEPIPFIIISVPMLIMIGMELYKVNIGHKKEEYIVLWIYYGLYCLAMLGGPILAMLGSLLGCVICFCSVILLMVLGKYVVSIINKFVLFLVKIRVISIDNVRTDNETYIETKGKITKAVIEGKNCTDKPMYGYYYLVVRYFENGKKMIAKTRRSYSLAAIAKLLEKYDEVDIRVKGEECDLPNLDARKLKGEYDPKYLRKIRIIDCNFGLLNKVYAFPLYFSLTPLLGVIPACIYVYHLIVQGKLVTAIVSMIIVLLVTSVTIFDFIRKRKALKKHMGI